MDRVTIVGVGGIGCALGHALLTGGENVTFVENDPAKLEWGRRNGVAVAGQAPLPAKLVAFEGWSAASGGPVLLCTKCYDNRTVLERVGDSVELVPVQNGFDAQLLERTEVEGIASFVSECIPGTTHTRITRPGDLHIGLRSARAGRTISRRVESVIEVLERHGSFRVRRVPEVLPYKYSKLMYNAAISPLAAMAGLDNGELLEIAEARRLFFALLRENYRILKGAGVPLGRIGPIHPDLVDRILRLPLLARLLAVPFARSLRGTYCSMAGELPAGRSEVDNYNGHLLELAVEGDFPLNRKVYLLAKRMQAERLTPGLGRLEELLD